MPRPPMADPSASKGKRGPAFAAGLVAGVGVALLFAVWAFPWFRDPAQDTGYRQGQHEEYAQHEQDRGDPHFWISPFNGWLFAEDSLAQWLMAIFGAAATGVSLYAVFLVRDTLSETRKAAGSASDAAQAAIESNRLNREMFVSEQRAWLVIESAKVTSDLIWERERGRGAFSVQTIVRNAGKTPAFDVRVETRSDARMRRREDVYREVSLEVGRRYRSIQTGEPAVLGEVVFPGGMMIYKSEVTITQDDFDAICKAHNVSNDYWTEPLAVFVTFCICVDYGLALTKERHRTGTILRLEVAPDEGGNVAIGPYYGNTKRNRLRLVRDGMNSMRAD